MDILLYQAIPKTQGVNGLGNKGEELIVNQSYLHKAAQYVLSCLNCKVCEFLVKVEHKAVQFH